MRCLMLVMVLCNTFGVFGQADSIRVDTAAAERSYSVLPGMASLTARQSSHALLDQSLNETAQPILGVSVLNTARGHVPGMYIDPYYQVDTLTWRNSSPLFVIDGMVFNQSIASYSNMNAFEYGDMHMILGRNGTIPYGGAGNSGALILNSKTGEGFTRPVLDFNTYTTYAWGDPSNSSWQLSNSLAYSQDFGKVDLRISTNYTPQPPGNGTYNGLDRMSVRINTGFTHNRLSARLILNSSSGWLDQHFSNYWPTAGSSSTSDTKNLLQGNLMLSYALTDWLTISSQASRTGIGLKSNRILNTSETGIATDNRYDAGNILLNVNKKLSPSFALTGAFGVLANQVFSKSTGTANSPNGLVELSREYNAGTNSILYTTEFGFKEKLFAGVNFRRDFVSFYNQSDAFNAYSVFGSYNFHGFIDRSGKVLSFAKLRLSYGQNDNLVDNTVPRLGTIYPYPSARRTNSFEVGLNAAFLKNRILFMGNYYLNKSYSPTPSAPPIDPATGYTVTYFNYLYNTHVNGFEFVAKMNILQKKGVNLTTQLNAGWSTTEVEQVNQGTTYILTRLPSNLIGGSGVTVAWPSIVPDWTGGWLNQATLGRFSVSMLIDISAGGYFYALNPSVFAANQILPGVRTLSPSDSTISITAADIRFNSAYFGNYPQNLKDRTYIKLRDVSVGYNFPLATRMKAYVSVSFRNLVMLYSKSGQDPETENSFTGYGSLNKSMSVNFSLQF
jgi:hypothetical protein